MSLVLLARVQPSADSQINLMIDLKEGPKPEMNAEEISKLDLKECKSTNPKIYQVMSK